jgi:hypothetical protein
MLDYVIVYVSQTKLSVESETLYNDVEIKNFSAKKSKLKWMCSNM